MQNRTCGKRERQGQGRRVVRPMSSAQMMPQIVRSGWGKKLKYTGLVVELAALCKPPTYRAD